MSRPRASTGPRPRTWASFTYERQGDPVPLSAVTTVESRPGPEFTMRYNLYRSAQINATAKPGYSSGQVMKALEEVFHETMPPEMGLDYIGMSFQEKKAQEGIPASAIFCFSLLCVFLILAAQYESWSLPFSVLLCTPMAVFGAFAAHMPARAGEQRLRPDRADRPDRPRREERHPHRRVRQERYEQGKALDEAALEGARLRLRPILMTSFAFLLGVLPLAFSSGAGAAAPAGHGHGGHGRHGGGVGDRRLPHPRDILCGRKDVTRQRKEGVAPEGKEGRCDGIRLSSPSFSARACGACTVGPDYRRPPVETPRAWRFQDTEAARRGQYTLVASNSATPSLTVCGDRVEGEQGRQDRGGACRRVRRGASRTTRSAQFPQVGGGASACRTTGDGLIRTPPGDTGQNPYDTFRPSSRPRGRSTCGDKLRRATEAARADLLEPKRGGGG